MFQRGAVIIKATLRSRNDSLMQLNKHRKGRRPAIAFSSQTCSSPKFTDGGNGETKRDDGIVDFAPNGNDEKRSPEKSRRTRDKKWELHFEKLANFVAEHGHTMVSPKHSPTLHSWMERQKVEYRKREMNDPKHCMTDYRLERLNQLGMTWESLEDRWETRYDELREFYQTHGHAHIQQSENCSLYMWCMAQRRQYKRLQEGASSTLTPERLEKLNQIGLLWDPSEDKWMERYKALVRYKANYGDCLVPRSFSQDPELASWVGTQREKYIKKLKMEQQHQDIPPDDLGIISNRRIALLNELGFEWKPLDLLWNSKYEILRAFVDANGFGIMPSRNESRSMFSWMNRQRKLYRERLQGMTNTLTDERILKLDYIGFDWNEEQ